MGLFSRKSKRNQKVETVAELQPLFLQVCSELGMLTLQQEEIDRLVRMKRTEAKELNARFAAAIQAAGGGLSFTPPKPAPSEAEASTPGGESTEKAPSTEPGE